MHRPAIVLLLLLCAGGVARAEELRVWLTRQDRGMEAALRVFESRHPGLHIVTSLYIDGLDSQKLMTAIVGGEPPDVVEQDRFTVGEWAASGALLPLNSRLAGAIDEKDFYHA